MKHDELQQLLVLKHYGELLPQEARLLEEHLASCASCREEEKKIEQMASIVSASLPAAGDTVIEESRARLIDTLLVRKTRGEAGSRRKLINLWRDGLGGFLRPPAWAGAACLFGAAGFLLGYLVFGTGGPAEPNPAELFRNPEIRVTGVTFEQTDPATDQVALSFNAIRRVRIEGTLEDTAIQRVLAHALIAEENPGVRLQAVSALQQERSNDQEAVTALIGALRTDPNPAVRQQALTALRNYPGTAEIRSAFADALLNDGNARIRIEAVDALAASAESGAALDRELIERLQQRLRQEDNSYVRRKGNALLEQAGFSMN